MSDAWRTEHGTEDAGGERADSSAFLKHGRYSQAVKAEFAEGRRLATLIPGARFVALESRNHILVADEPAWAQFRAELRDFLGPAEVSTPAELPELSDRELEVLALVSEGLSTRKSRRDCSSA